MRTLRVSPSLSAPVSDGCQPPCAVPVNAGFPGDFSVSCPGRVATQAGPARLPAVQTASARGHSWGAGRRARDSAFLPGAVFPFFFFLKLKLWGYEL